MSDDKTCPFCAPDAERIIASNDLALAIRDAFPLTEGHTLVVSRRHVASWFDANVEEQQAIMQLINEIAKQAPPRAYNIGINVGAAAGQTVMHLHVHLIPRREGDVDDPRGGIRWVIPGKARYWP